MSKGKEDFDVNNVFESLLFAEEQAQVSGYVDGYKSGKGRLLKGYHLGYHRASLVASQLGYYYGVLEQYLHCNKTSSDKVTSLAIEILDNIHNFPKHNDDTVDIFKTLEDIKFKYVRFCSLAKLNPAYPSTTKHFYKIIDFLSIYQQLIDCHLVDFISEELWDKCLPNLLRSELENVEAINAIWNQSDKITQLNDFMKTTKSLSLKACPMTMDLEDFSKLVLHVDNDEWKFNVEMKKKDTGFMKKKKFHEVEVLGNVVGQIARSTNSLVIDAGAGKAYLSTYLSDNYKLPVLAIDSSDLCHKAAIQRAEKMKKKGNKSTSLVKYVVTKIDDNTDYNTMVKENFPNWNLKNNLILTGLHTCGSLVHSLMKMFLKSNDFQIICIVPCCYHLVNESLSKQINFSKNARMLAQQCIERTAETKSLPPSLFYRAVLQVLLNSMVLGLRDVRIGRGGPMYDFPTYAKWALMKIGIDKTKIPSMENLQELYRSYEHYKLKFDIFQMLRISLSPVLEAAIILDRVIYLQNSKQCSKSIILRLFDPVLSPRHYAIVAIK